MDIHDFRYEDDSIWQDFGMESTGPENKDFSEYMNHNQGGYRRGGGYGMNGPPRFHGPRGPIGQSGPRYTWGRGFGPAGPPMQQRYPRENKPMRYLLRCGLTKQILKGLPKTLLQLMEPQYCGLCAQGFDNFAMSRLHYISKNHAKKQKKWQLQHSTAFHRPGEIPMKSRDLYCELCDVHITSTIHAESHYAGKPHRAIVEGRRNPKNPALLQQGMQDRLEQLIRREKKNLKPVEESAAQAAKKQPRPVQPELFCNICKASMTCTEQMTMHLNGKKHLSKEKQHILKMMKGETETPAANDTITEEKDTNDGDEDKDKDLTEKMNQEDDDDDEYGWGNGSGTWDDDPQ